ncbi:MAG: hypothetical protein ACK4GT_17205 [Pararhodobacter sp.]
MKLAASLIIAILLAAPASAQVLRGGNCGGSQTLITAGSETGNRVIVLRGSCDGPRREIIHTLRPGQPSATTIILRPDRPSSRAQAAGEQNGPVATGASRIIRVP